MGEDNQPLIDFLIECLVGKEIECPILFLRRQRIDEVDEKIWHPCWFFPERATVNGKSHTLLVAATERLQIYSSLTER